MIEVAPWLWTCGQAPRHGRECMVEQSFHGDWEAKSYGVCLFSCTAKWTTRSLTPGDQLRTSRQDCPDVLGVDEHSGL
jgi:hypothetical protein